ncbi:MAG: leucyl aminopeptidase family protein, partial [Alphaproteobacteria bacterium]
MPVAHNLISRARKDTVPITIVADEKLDDWCTGLAKGQREWLDGTGFTGKAGSSALLPSEKGGLDGVVFVIGAATDQWSWSELAARLPEGSYRLAGRPSRKDANDAALGWGMAAYEFTRYRKPRQSRPDMVWPATADRADVLSMLNATAMLRDLINTPAEDLGPSELAEEARKVGRTFKAKVRVTAGDALLKANYPMIHTVGRA